MGLFSKEYFVHYKIVQDPWPVVINAHTFIKARSISHLQKKLNSKHSPWLVLITKVKQVNKKGGFL